MKFLFLPSVLTLILFLALSSLSFGQTTIKGKVRDATTGEGLVSASVVVKGTTDGMVTDYDGNFEFTTSAELPLTVEVSYVGYLTQTIEVTEADQTLRIDLAEDAITTEVVEVRGRRISEKQQQSALTMESMDNIAIKETPAANFYDGLGSLKDVDLTAASLGFKIINTRGFNSTSPVRSLQIIDGVDNQSPGLNFSLGNFLGASELDVNRVNLIVGASSAFYGPNAFNGVISMETKNPFLHKGLSAMLKVGERNLVETGFRWAHATTNKEGYENFAYKINFSYFRADDWEAENYDDVFDTPTDESNPGGYDAVNIYGDEYNAAFDLSGAPLSNPGLGTFHRRGYREIDMVDYNSNNTKIGAAFHFRLKPELDLRSPELIVASNYSRGTTVYQGDNRFSLRNIQFFQHRLELQKRDDYFIRAYVTHEDAGDSYDPYFTALLLQREAKSDEQFLRDYINYWQLNIVDEIRGLEGYPNPLDYIGRPTEFRAAFNSFINQPSVNNSLFQWHAETQAAANMANPRLGETQDFFEVGTARFQEAFNRITTSKSFVDGGTRFFDRSALGHIHGEKQFNDIPTGGSITDLDLRVGANARLYLPNSDGTILLDTFGRDITNYEYGLYGGGTMEFNNRLKLSASIRLDKNQNFDYLISPAASLVYVPTPDQTLRVSFSSAIRNPTLADQYLFYNVGRAILIGNLDGFQNLITTNSLVDYLNTLDESTLDFFDVDPIRPEKVKTFELGYRATLGQMFVDATYYYSFYNDFIGFNLGVDARFDQTTGIPTNIQAYRVSANATDQVTTQGFSIGLNYYFGNYYVFNGNYSWNKLNTQSDDPIIPAFNTPEHKFNIGISGRDIPINLGGLTIRNVGFNINYKWIDSFLFEGSPQFTGIIPQYDLLDAQVNWRANKINTTFKLGASNLLNNETFQTYGGPTIGRLAYFSATYEFVKR
jgi:outer membrane receptor protein involved in Fe transport